MGDPGKCRPSGYVTLFNAQVVSGEWECPGTRNLRTREEPKGPSKTIRLSLLRTDTTVRVRDETQGQRNRLWPTHKVNGYSLFDTVSNHRMFLSIKYYIMLKSPVLRLYLSWLVKKTWCTATDHNEVPQTDHRPSPTPPPPSLSKWVYRPWYHPYRPSDPSRPTEKERYLRVPMTHQRVLSTWRVDGEVQDYHS